MNYGEYVEYILAGILDMKEKDVPDYVSLLKPEYFENPIDRKLFEALLKGERDLIALGKIAKSNARIANLSVMAPYLSKGTVQDFKVMVLDEQMREAVRKEDWDSVQRILDERKNGYSRDLIKEYEEYKQEYSELIEGDVMGMSTGINTLDQATLGLIPNHIWVCGAYYGYGKTYFAINLINSVLKQDKRVVFFTLEMTSTDIIQRLVALKAGLNLIETVGTLEEDKLQLREEAEQFIYEKIKSRQLVIDDYSRDGDGVISKMMIEEMKEHVDFVAIDYIQLLAGDDQYESLRDLTKKLQGATKKMGTTTLVLSQISNASQREGKSALVDGFKGAGDIGQIANVAIRVIRERSPETGEFSPMFTLRLTKVRHSKPCSVECVIDFPGGKIHPGSVIDDEEDTNPLQELFNL